MITQIVLRLFLSLILSGIIGFEREHMNRPAGLRTHILVCIGATLIQITSMDFCIRYKGIYNIDPLRMSAQVISGIGFLGAGTIIKEGVNIKGLTTAASIWAVACIGITVGTGFYFEAVIATAIIYIALRGLKKVDEFITKNKITFTVEVIVDDMPGKVGQIGSTLGKHNINISNMEMVLNENQTVTIILVVKLLHDIPHENLMDELMQISGVKRVRFI